ncbi:MAG: SulP family inorganic anion transporter [Bacteroidales bacterium]|jgi:SulP family sulfate permease|nr:SulP family inorganic anion transporter [Bacteroidales bacterium]
MLFYPKFFSLLRKGFTHKQIRNDVLSGIVVGIVALPLAIAFAVASGVSPEKGLITAVVAGFLISFLGGSRVQIGGPTGAFIVIVYAIVEQYGLNGLMISTILAGFMLIGFGLLRLGSLLRFFPHPLIVGFTSGIAVVIFSTQIKDAFGMDIAKVPSAFVEKWSLYFTHFDSINLTAFALTLLTIAITVGFRRITSKVPGSFIAILVVTAIAQIFDLPVTNIHSFFGEISGKIQLSLPSIDLSNIQQYIGPAVTIALLGGIESLLSAVVSDGMISGNHRSNTELIAQGIANVVTPFFGGIPATGAIARTVTNVKTGGRTPIAGIVHAITLLLIMLFFGKWAQMIPMACLAGILMVVAYNMSEWRSFKAILKGSFFDVSVLLTTFFLTVLVDLSVAIEVGVVLSALLFMKRMADLGKDGLKTIDSDMLTDYSTLPKSIAIYEISGPFFFASAKHYSEVIKETGDKTKVLIIRMRHVPFIDSTGTNNLKEAIRILKHSGTHVVLSGVSEAVNLEIEKAGITKLMGNENILPSFDEAVARAKNLTI